MIMLFDVKKAHLYGEVPEDEKVFVLLPSEVWGVLARLKRSLRSTMRRLLEVHLREFEKQKTTWYMFKGILGPEPHDDKEITVQRLVPKVLPKVPGVVVRVLGRWRRPRVEGVL